MEPEDSEKKEVKVYMMVDGQPVEIAPEIAEIKLPEGQQGGDVLPLQECEITVKVERPPVPLVHGRMIYRCENCGKSWPMYLEKGIEEFGEDHKPSPFTIGCPYCGGWAMDVSGIQKVRGGGYVPLQDGYSFFANKEDRDCGVPVFYTGEHKRQAGRKKTTILISDKIDHIWRDAERARAMVYLVARTEDEARKIEETACVFAERLGVSLEQAVTEVLNALNALKLMAEEFQKSMERIVCLSEECIELYAVSGDFLDFPTAWDRKEAREKQRAVERAAASRFRQYKTRERAWTARKRTGPRRREWRGPYKEG